MLRRKLMTAALVGTLAAGTLGGSVAAYARNGGDSRTDETSIVANAKITMAQAIAAAEQQVGGKAAGSEIEDQDGTVYFEVQVLKNGTRHKVLIDPQSGKVVKTVTAENERGENGHEGNDD